MQLDTRLKDVLMHAKLFKRTLALLRTPMRASELIVHTQAHTEIHQVHYLLVINVFVNVLMDQIKVSHTRTKTPLLHVLMPAKPFHGIHVTAPTPMHVWEPNACIQIHTLIEQYDLHFNSTL